LWNFGFEAGQRARGSCSVWNSVVSFRTAAVAVFRCRRTRGVTVTSARGRPAFFERGGCGDVFLRGIGSFLS